MFITNIIASQSALAVHPSVKCKNSIKNRRVTSIITKSQVGRGSIPCQCHKIQRSSGSNTQIEKLNLTHVIKIKKQNDLKRGKTAQQYVCITRGYSR
jgi:hypothetical protein